MRSASPKSSQRAMPSERRAAALPMRRVERYRTLCAFARFTLVMATKTSWRACGPGPLMARWCSNPGTESSSSSAPMQPGRQFFLVVDEINRGDVPRIFGELITIIEHDKRDTAIKLPLTGSAFAVPRNVFLIGTMNTADRSISLMDTALRRRFGFVELMPDSKQLAGRNPGELPLGAWLDALNGRLRRHLKRDARNLQIGHAYLLPPQPITSMAEFARILRDDIIPLIEEYCYDDFSTLREILGPELVDVQNGLIRDEMFMPNREQDLILALSFEQMQPIALDQGLASGSLAIETPDEAEADEDGQLDAADAES